MIDITFGLSGTAIVESYYTLDANITLPALTTTTGVLGECLATTWNEPWNQKHLPMLTVSGVAEVTISADVGVYEEIKLPFLEVYAAGLDSALGVANIELPPVTTDGFVLQNILATGSIRIPLISCDTIGIASVLVKADITLPVQNISVNARIDEIGIGNISIPFPHVNSYGYRGVVGVANRTLSPLRVYGYGYELVTAVANIELPMLQIRVGSSLSGTITLCMNVKNKSLTTFSNYNFNSFANFAGKNIAATPSGIYDLTGTKDITTDINWNFRTGLLDLEIDKVKKLLQMWFGYKTDGDLIVTIIQPDGESYEYDLTSYDRDYEEGSRVKVGKGIRSRYLQLDVSNIEGHSIDLDVIKFHFNRPGANR